MKKLNQKEIEDIIKKYNEFETLTKICKDYNTHHHFIRKILKKYGVKIRTGEEVRWKGYMDVGSNFITCLKSQCKRLKLTCNVNLQDIWNIYLNQNNKCILTGNPIDFKNKTVFLARNSKEEGYTKNNTLLVCKEISIMKRRFDMKTFLAWCNLISNKKHISNIIEIYSQHHSYQGYKNISLKNFGKIKDSAKTRNIEFLINIQDMWNQYEKQNGCCNITGIPIYFGKINKDYAGRTASLDRIDNTKGYTLDNIQWIHKDLNKMKYTLDNDLFIETAKLVANYRK